MNDLNLITQTDELEKKVNLLIRAYINIREKFYYLQKDNKKLKEKNIALEEELKKLINQQKNSKIVSGSEEGKESVEQIRKQINSYVKMLDECIDQLDN